MMQEEYKTFLYVYQEQGVKAVAQRYNISERTAQRWKKNGSIPSYRLEKPIEPQRYQKINEWYKAEYAKVKKRDGNIKALAKEMKVSERTAQRWYAKGLPSSYKGQSKIKQPIQKYKISQAKKIDKIAKANGMHGVIKYRVYEEGRDPYDLYSTTKVYRISSKNYRACMEEKALKAQKVMQNARSRYQVDVDILVNKIEFIKVRRFRTDN